MYEGGVRIPFMIQWDNKLPSRYVYEHAVSSLDIFPTCAAAAGADIPEYLDGVDLIPFLTGKNQDAPHEILFWRQGSRTALRKGDWKIVYNPRNREWELYNLAEDLGESENLMTRFPWKASELKADWEELNNKMETPIF